MTVTTSASTTSTTSEAEAAAWESPYGTALTWLVAGTFFLAVGGLLMLLAAAQSASPGLVSIGAATSVGRVRAAAHVLLVYGGLGMIGNGVALDLARRAARAPASMEKASKAAGALMTLGVALSALAVLTGRSTGRVGFEMPRPLAVVLALAQLLVLLAVLRTVSRRTRDEVHPSMWFVVAALFCAPFVILGGALPGVRGINDEIVLAFGLSGLKLLWLVPLGIGVALYVVPNAARAPLHSRQLAAVAFWGWFVFAPFAGPMRLVASSSQDWLETLGIAASIALGVPILAVVVLLIATYARRTSLAHGADLRYALAGVALLALWGALSVPTAGRSAAAYVHGTVAADGLAELALFGVAGALLLAGVLHSVPNVTGNRLANPRIAGGSVWLLAIGAAVIALSLLVAGYVQGVLWAQGVRTGVETFAGGGFVDVVNAVKPMLWLRVLGEALVALAWVVAFQQVFSTSTAGEE
ncbi:MAG TPA: cbb3-type cytochrome c oxidase subunit I [Frankiaceae bacterium]|nr:cbb3-type cytochrome c oxidase subunit I [Frankiaceae bacterium]